MRWLWWQLLLMLACCPAWAGSEVRIVLSEKEAAYQEAAAAMVDALGRGVDVEVRAMSEIDVRELRGAENRLWIPVGLKAARLVAEHHEGRGAVLGAMLPMASARKLLWRLAPNKLAYVYIDQPVARSLALSEALLPSRKRIGVIASAENEAVLAELRAEAAQRGLMLNKARVNLPEEVGPALRRILSGSDVLLLLPDTVVMGSGQFKNVLLAAYRMRLPVLGFSPGLMKSGAVAGVFSTPRQIGRQAGLMARHWLASGSLPATRHAQEFSIDINESVARSLGLNLPSGTDMARLVGASE